MKTSNLSEVKKENRKAIYQCIREHGQLTITDLEYNTRLSRPTISGLVRQMVNEKLLVKNGYGNPNGGRAPVLYKANAEAACALGIDFEFPTVRMAVSDLEGTLIDYSIRVYPEGMHKNDVLDSMKHQIEDIVFSSGIKKEKLLGAGVGVPGVLDRKNRFSVLIERISGWENVPIGEILEDYLKKPVYICNDVNLLSWAERKVSGNESDGDALYIVIRNGIGMAIWHNGCLIEGEMGNAGRIGHMSVDLNGLQCRCGSRGCLGLYSSERAMLRMYKEETGTALNKAEELVFLAENGDTAAQKVIECSGKYLGVGIVNAANIFDISNVILETTFDSSRLLKAAQEALDKREINVIRRKVNIRSGNLTEKRFGLGGCFIVLDKEEANLLER